LNSESISDIVRIFTRGEATSYFKDGVIHILILPPKDNKRFKFGNVEQELQQKMPAHLLFEVSRNYREWAKIMSDNLTWGDVLSNHIN
jgi:ABC-type sulfate transport system substrate-binding protein